jgi:hypothetical protein
MSHLKRWLAILVLCFACHDVSAQDGTDPNGIVSFSYIQTVSGKADKLAQKLDKQSIRALRQLQKQEARINRKLERKDSLKAREILAVGKEQYHNLDQSLNGANLKKPYIASLDTLSTSLKFLEKNPQWLSAGKYAPKQLGEALDKVQALESRFQKAEEIRKFLKERRQYLKEQLGTLGFVKEMKQVNKQVYYYSEQLNEYKTLLKDHRKAERKALELLSKTKLFKDFMRKNSQLAALFPIAGDPDDPSSMQPDLSGLQTRAQVSNLIRQQLGASGSAGRQQFQQNIREAQGELNKLKEKANKILPNGSSSGEMPDGFKPNNQKTRRFLERFELGTNVQSQRSNGLFPVTSDIGLSLGYKLNDNSVIGVGASYKMGWGKDIRHIDISHQGAGLRSFIDWKIKGSFWVSGGYEMNYRSAYQHIAQLKDIDAWQQSGLLGLSKVVSLKTKFFKKTKLQLLWDFLSYQQIPRTQPVLFRVGYSF